MWVLRNMLVSMCTFCRYCTPYYYDNLVDDVFKKNQTSYVLSDPNSDQGGPFSCGTIASVISFSSFWNISYSWRSGQCQLQCCCRNWGNFCCLLAGVTCRWGFVGYEAWIFNWGTSLLSPILLLRRQFFECLAYGENGTVHFWLGRAIGWQAIAKVEMTRNVATGFGKD